MDNLPIFSQDNTNNIYTHLISTTDDENQHVAFHNNFINKTVYFFAIVVGLSLFIFLGIFTYDFIKHG
jgi:hypothetical protein